MSLYLNKMLNTLEKDKKKGREALSSNANLRQGADTYKQGMMDVLQRDAPKIQMRNDTLDLNPYTTTALNMRFQQTYSTLDNARKKYGADVDPYEDALRLTDRYGDTVRKSYDLFGGNKAKDYISIADKDQQKQLQETLWGYQYQNSTPEQLRGRLEELQYQSPSQITARNQQNVINLAKEKGAGRLTPEEEKEARMYEEAARYTGKGNVVNGLTGIAYAPLTETGMETEAGKNPFVANADTREQYRQKAQDIRKKSELTFEQADKYLQQDAGYAFAAGHQGDLTPYIQAASDMTNVIAKAAKSGWGSLTEPEKESARQVLSRVNVGGVGYDALAWDEMSDSQVTKALGSLTGARGAAVDKLGKQWAEELKANNGIYSRYDETAEQAYVLGMYRNTLEGARRYAEEAKGTDEEGKAKDNLFFVEHRTKDQELRNSADFAELSQVNPEYLASEVYARVNGLPQTNRDTGIYLMPYGGYPATLGTQNEYFTDGMTDEEKATFNAYANRDGLKTALDYLKSIEYDLTKRENERQSKIMYDLGASGPGGAALASVLSVPASLLRGAGYLDVLGQRALNDISGALGGSYRPINQNSLWQLPGNLADSARQGVMDTNDWNVNVLGRDTDLFDFMYGTGMSMADSVAAGATGFGGPILGLGAAQNAVKDTYDRGGNDRQAMLMGTTAGIFETLFENWSIGKFYDEMKHLGKRGFKDAAINMLAQAGINFSEEFNTELFDMMADEQIMGTKSQTETDKREYMRLGMSEDEANARIAEDKAWRLAEAGFGGALMGAGFGGISNVTSNISTGNIDKKTGAALKPGTRVNLATLAREFSETKELADKYDPAKATNRQTGELLRETLNQLTGQDRRRLIDALAVDFQEAGIEEKNSRSIVQMMAGEELSPEQIQSLARDEKAMDALYEALGVKEKEEKPAESGPKFGNMKLGENNRLETMDTEEGLNIAPMPGTRPAEETRPERPALHPESEAVSLNGEAVPMGQQERRKMPARSMLNTESRMQALDGEAVPTRQSIEAEQKKQKKPAIVQPMAFEAGAQDGAEGTKGKKTVRITGISRDKSSGAVEVTLEDGQRVALEDAGISREAQDLAAEAADLPQDAQNAMVANHRKGQDTTAYARGFKAIFNMAAIGQDGKTLRSLYGDELTQEQRDAAIEAGKADYEQTRVQRAARTLQAAQELKRRGFAFRTLDEGQTDRGGVYLAQVEKPMSDGAAAQLRVINDLAKDYGVQVRVYDHLDANGFYQGGTNIINVALDAEEEMLGRTTSHELFHFVKEWNREAGQQIQDFVLDTLRNTKGYDLDARIEQVRTKGGQNLDPEAAKEDIAAESILDVLANEKNIRALYKEVNSEAVKAKNPGLWDQITNWIKDTVAKLRAGMERIAWNHPEVRAMKDQTDKIAQIAEWMDEAARQAGENYRAAQEKLFPPATNDADVKEYLKAMGQAVTLEDAAAEADGLASRLFMRAEEEWIGAHQDEYEQGFDAFRQALDEYTQGKKTLPRAFTDAGLDVPKENLFPVLAYAGRQWSSARRQMVQENKFQMSANVEVTKDLIAVHNLDHNYLEDIIELGGLPMPSIAITKNNIGHKNFGDVSFIFRSDTIDPVKNNNSIYGNDAWTPRMDDLDIYEEDDGKEYIREEGAYGRAAFDDSGVFTYETEREFNAENVVDVFKRLGNKANAPISATAAKRYRTLQDMKNDKARLQNLTDQEYNNIHIDLRNKVNDFIDDLQKELQENDHDEYGDIENLDEYISQGIKEAGRRYAEEGDLQSIINGFYEMTGITLNDRKAEEIKNIIKEAQEMPTRYFEAKPKRVIGFGEIERAVVPEGVPSETLEALKKAGVKEIILYPDGDEEARKEAMNGRPDLMFSLRAQEADTSEETKNLQQKAVGIFGKTYNWGVTGYVLPDGTRLDFSGKREGSDGRYREEDHRAILDAYGEDTDMGGTEAMIDFMRRGAIRIMPESGGIQMQTIPTRAQLQALDGFISKMRGEVVIDIDDENGDTVFSKEYDRGTFSRTILADIPDLFEQAAKSRSDTARFHDVLFSQRADAEYIAAVEREDEEEAQKMVDEAAKAAGFQMKMYHGTDYYKDITVFKNGKKGWLGPGIYTTEDKRYAQRYADMNGGGGKVYSVFIRANNPLIVRTDTPAKEILMAAYGKESVYNKREQTQGNGPSILTKADINKLKDKGYDAIIWEYGSTPKEANVFSSEQMKSADPITYDNAGNVIPLSERFNRGNPDIRYSQRADSDERQEAETLETVAGDPELYTEMKRDADERAALQMIIQLHKLTTGGGEDALIQPGAFEKRLSEIADRIQERTGTKYGPVKLRAVLRKIYQAMEQSDYSPGEILQYARDKMKDLLDASPGVLVEMDETTKDILRELRNRRFYLSDDQKSEIKNQYGTVSRYSQKNMGTLRIVRRDAKTASLEDVWAEDLAPRLPGTFAPDTSPLDMPGILDAWLENAKEKKYNGDFGRNIGSYATDLALNAMLDFYDVPGALKTKADIREGFREQYDEQARRIRELTATARDAVNTAREEYAEKYRQRIEKAQERRQETERKQDLRKKITRDVRHISLLNVRASDTQHVPEEMRAAALQAVEPFLAGSGVFNPAEMLRLSREYQILKERAGEVRGFDEDILTTIEGLPDRIAGRRLSELTEAELQDLADIMGNLRKMIADANEAFVNGRRTTVDALSGQLKADMREKGQAKQGPIAALARKFQYLEETPVYFADRVGGVIKDMIADFFQGESDWSQVVNDAIRYKDEMLDKYHVKDWINDRQHARFVTQHGDQIELDRQQAMTLYAQWKREQSNRLQNAAHLRVGGFMYGKGVKYEGVDTMKPHPLTESDMQMIRSYLTDEQMAFADAMVKYLSEDMAKIGNEVSMRLYGYEKYKENYYFPYGTDKRFLVSDLTQTGEQVRQPKSQGFTKALMQNAATPLTVDNFMDMWGSHVNQMALYKGFAEAVDTMSRVFNQRAAGEIRVDSVTGEEFTIPPESNWIEMERALGAEGVDYLKTLVRDVSGGVRADERGFAAKGLGLFKKGAVLGNLSVVLQQPTAYARAMNMINPAYLNLVSKETARLPQNIREMYEYSGVARIKKMGRFDTGTGKGAIELLTDGTQDRNAAEKTLEAIDKVAGIGAEKADEWTWGLLWGAVKKETAHNNPDLQAGSEEFLRAAAARFDDICRHTQVYDSVLSKSTWMRSSSMMDKIMTSFMAEPTLSLNMLLDAMETAGQPGGGRKIARAAGTFAVNSLLVALAKSIMTASRRKKDEGRTWLEKYLAESAGNFLDDISPFGLISMIPWARDAVSLLEGYDVKRSDMDAAEQLIKGYKSLKKYLDGGDVTLEDTIQNTLGPVANLFGIPLKNLWRDTEAIIGNVFGGTSAGGESTARDIKYSVLDNLSMGPVKLWDSSRSAYYGRMEQALLDGDMEKYNELRGYMEETNQVKPDAVTQGIKAELKASVQGGLISDDRALEVLTGSLGMDQAKAWDLVDKWVQEKDHEGEEEYSYQKYSTLWGLMDAGKDLAAEKKRLAGGGVTDKAIDSAVKQHIGDQYKEGAITEKQAENLIRKYMGETNAENIHWIIDEWAYKRDNGSEASYSPYADVYDAVKNGKSLAAPMKEMTGNGYEEKDVRSEIRSQIGKWYKGGELTRAQTESKLKQYAGITDANDLYWAMDQLDYEKANAKNKGAAAYAKYASYYKAVETGNNLTQETNRYLSHGVKKETMASQITSNFKPKYTALVNAGRKAEADKMMERLLRAYEVLGYERSKKRKDIEKWLK